MSLLARFLRGGAATSSFAATIDLDDPAISIDPFQYYEKLRREGEMVFLPRHDAWLVLGHVAAKTILAQPDVFSNAPYAFIDPVMLAADPPRHGPIRRIVSRRFGGETLRRLEDMAAALTLELLRPELDIVADFARPLSRRVAGALIGFDDGILGRIAHAEEAAAGPDAFAAACAAVDEVAHEARMFDDLLRDGEGIVGRDEARSLVRLLWFASTATTERTVAHCVLRLLEDPALHRRLRSEPRLSAAFAEEVTRLNPPEILIRRRAARTTMVAGATIPEAATVQICLAAANRDPACFEAPAELRLDRGAAANLSFGSGIHACVGAQLTRRVVAAAMHAFLASSERLRPLQPLETVPWVHAMIVRAPRALRVAL
jgi:cytochrome P450